MQISELATLPLEQRVRAMELLWDSLARDSTYEPSPDWHATVLAERRAEFNRDKTTPWSEVRERLGDLASSRR
jgi:hypothetical protein